MNNFEREQENKGENPAISLGEKKDEKMDKTEAEKILKEKENELIELIKNTDKVLGEKSEVVLLLQDYANNVLPKKLVEIKNGERNIENIPRYGNSPSPQNLEEYAVQVENMLKKSKDLWDELNNIVSGPLHPAMSKYNEDMFSAKQSGVDDEKVNEKLYFEAQQTSDNSLKLRDGTRNYRNSIEQGLITLKEILLKEKVN